jgi:hypothetical protein
MTCLARHLARGPMPSAPRPWRVLPSGRRGMLNREKLTAKQEQVFRFLATYFAKHQRMPTQREVCKHIGCKSVPNGARTHLLALVRKGYIGWEQHGGGTHGGTPARSFEIVGLAEAIAPVVKKHIEEMLKEATGARSSPGNQLHFLQHIRQFAFGGELAEAAQAAVSLRPIRSDGTLSLLRTSANWGNSARYRLEFEEQESNLLNVGGDDSQSPHSTRRSQMVTATRLGWHSR